MSSSVKNWLIFNIVESKSFYSVERMKNIEAIYFR